MSDSNSLLSGNRKKTVELRKAKYELVESNYAENELAFDKKVKDLNDLKHNNAKKSEALSARTNDIDNRGLLASIGMGVVETVTGVDEREVLKAEIEDLANSQQAAIEKQSELIEDYKELQEEKKAVLEEKERYLRSEKSAIKKELKDQQKERDALEEKKAAAEKNGEDTQNIDAQIAENNQKTEQLDQAKANNIQASADARSESKKSSSSPVQSCPKVCESHDLVVHCSHGGGKRKAVAAPNRRVPELHVMSVAYENSSTGGVDEISAYIQGACGKGKTDISPVGSLSALLDRNEQGSHCPYITISGGNPSYNVALPGTEANPLRFNAYSPSIEWAVSFVSKPTWYVFFKYLFFKKESEKYTKYLIEGKNCDGSGNNSIAEVYAHTHEKWVMEAAVGWDKGSIGKTKTSNDIKKKSSNPADASKLPESQWALEGKFAGSLDTRNFSLEATPDMFKGMRECLSHLLYFFEAANGKVEKAKDGKSSNDIVSWDWLPPKIAIAAEREKKENSSNNMVDTEYKYALKLDPLIGVKADVDVLQALIHLAANCVAPGAGSGALKFIEFVESVLLKSEKAAEEANSKVEFKAELKLETELVLAGELSCTKSYGGEPQAAAVSQPVFNIPTSDTSGAAELAVVGKIMLKGIVKAEVRHTNSWFEVHAAVGAGLSVGAKGGGPSEVAIKIMIEVANGEPDFKGEAEFKGLVLFFMSYATASVKKSKTNVEDENFLSDELEFEEPEGELEETITEKESKEVWTIFNPKKTSFWEG